jgi:hypothetical protein
MIKGLKNYCFLIIFQLIAELADDNTLGILAQDTDFLVYQYPDHVHYLSIQKLDFESLFADKTTLKTISYNRFDLVEHLNDAAQKIGYTGNTRLLTVAHLPLLATLKGNCKIYRGDLAPFHNRRLSKSSLLPTHLKVFLTNIVSSETCSFQVSLNPRELSSVSLNCFLKNLFYVSYDRILFSKKLILSI